MTSRHKNLHTRMPSRQKHRTNASSNTHKAIYSHFFPISSLNFSQSHQKQSFNKYLGNVCALLYVQLVRPFLNLFSQHRILCSPSTAFYVLFPSHHLLVSISFGQFLPGPRFSIFFLFLDQHQNQILTENHQRSMTWTAQKGLYGVAHQ